MHWMVLLYGMIVGSFLNVCIWRVPRGESILFPSSHCTNCNTSLKPIDLIPVVSYLSTGGKCRYCNNKVSSQYPFIELLNGGLWVLVYLVIGLSFKTVEYSLMVSLLLVISMIDYQHQIIPDQLVVTGFGIVILFNIENYISSPYHILMGIGGLLLAGGFFLLLAILTKGGMGGGDIKLMALLGFWLGWKWILMVMFLSFVLGAIISLLLITLKIKSRKEMIPFGPFIGIATVMTVLFGNDIINYYLSNIVEKF